MIVIRPGEARAYCLARSRMLRLWRWRDAALIDGLIGEAVWQLPVRVPEGAEPVRWRARLRQYFEQTLPGRRVGNPVLIWILLNIVIPIIVRLVIEWWLLERNEDVGRYSNVPVIQEAYTDE